MARIDKKVLIGTVALWVAAGAIAGVLAFVPHYANSEGPIGTLLLGPLVVIGAVIVFSWALAFWGFVAGETFAATYVTSRILAAWAWIAAFSLAASALVALASML
jgi:hypothetical protein